LTQNQSIDADKIALLEERFGMAFNTGRLRPYIHFLAEHKERFFSQNDAASFFERHVIENLEFARCCSEVMQQELAYPQSLLAKLNPDRSIAQLGLADAGSGPGLPGYFFSALNEPPHVTLIDSSRRRLGLLEQAMQAQAVPASRIKIIYARVDELRPQFQFICARALAPLPYLLEMVSGALLPGGLLFLATTAIPEDLLRKGAGHLGLGRFHVKQPLEWRDGLRKILIAQKIGLPEKGYPRPWKIIKAELAKSKKGSS
jgi:16S rRNA (guanine527-N7)-methyltransferase